MKMIVKFYTLPGLQYEDNLSEIMASISSHIPYIVIIYP